jgi:hypothetical protein
MTVVPEATDTSLGATESFASGGRLPGGHAAFGRSRPPPPQTLSRPQDLPTWCESPCGSKVGFGLGPPHEVDAEVTGLGSGEVLTQLAAGVRDQG